MGNGSVGVDGVRPVVSLSSDIMLKEGTKVGDVPSWNIK